MNRKGFFNKLLIKNITSLNFLINFTLKKLSFHGKYFFANKIFSKILFLIYEKTKKNPLSIYAKTLISIRPQTKLYPYYNKNIKVFIPDYINFLLSIKLTIKWLIKSVIENDKLDTYIERFTAEFLNTYESIGQTNVKQIKFYEFINNSQKFMEMETTPIEDIFF